MPTPDETAAFNQQDARAAAQNEQIDAAHAGMEEMLNFGGLIELLGGRRELKGPEDRVEQLQRLRKFVEMKQMGAGYDPQMQLDAIDHEIQRLSRPQTSKRPPAVQSAADNQKGY